MQGAQCPPGTRATAARAGAISAGEQNSPLLGCPRAFGRASSGARQGPAVGGNLSRRAEHKMGTKQFGIDTRLERECATL